MQLFAISIYMLLGGTYVFVIGFVYHLVMCHTNSTVQSNTKNVTIALHYYMQRCCQHIMWQYYDFVWLVIWFLRCVMSALYCSIFVYQWLLHNLSAKVGSYFRLYKSESCVWFKSEFWKSLAARKLQSNYKLRNILIYRLPWSPAHNNCTITMCLPEKLRKFLCLPAFLYSS